MQSSPFRLVTGSLALSLATFAACVDESSDTPATALDAGVSALDAASTADGAVATDASTPDVNAPVDATADTSPANDAASDGATSDATVDAAIDASVDATIDATVEAGPTTGQALAFDGVDDVVTMTVNPSETAFTAELWFKMAPLSDAGFAPEGNMFEVFNAGGGADRFLFVHLGKACFYVYNPGKGNPQFCSTANVNDGAWHHVAGTVGATSGTRFYLDGVEVGGTAANTTSSFSGGDQVRLGYGHFGFSSGFIRMYGTIDEVRLWSVERSAAEIAANRSVKIAPSTAGLQATWSLDESVTSAVAHDSVLLPDGGPSASDGTLTNFNLDGGTSPWVTPGAF